MVTVLFFARARELATRERWEREVSPGTTVSQFRDMIAEAFPRLAPLLLKSAIAIDGNFAKEDQEIPESAEVAVLPPVSGG